LLQKHPQIKKSINKLDDKISTEQMQKLNYEADGEGKEPAIVAKRFLEKHNYFEDEN
ncbi:glycine betaine ABC transporter substrate-binding protein, partial [Staphylococcus ureilyticus]|nr:glycine betaine ABC transporter substrate-binding protein [Staphylococcus ureilyticus]